jgi:hypothetical protein
VTPSTGRTATWWQLAIESGELVALKPEEPWAGLEVDGDPVALDLSDDRSARPTPRPPPPRPQRAVIFRASARKVTEGTARRELAAVVVVVLGRIVVDVGDGHDVLEVGIPPDREVHRERQRAF